MLDPLSGLTSCLGGVESSLTLTSDLQEVEKVGSTLRSLFSFKTVFLILLSLRGGGVPDSTHQLLDQRSPF